MDSVLNMRRLDCYWKVYEGLNRDSLLASLHGASALMSAELRSSSSSGGLLLEFTSDFSVQSSGFDAIADTACHSR